MAAKISRAFSKRERHCSVIHKFHRNTQIRLMDGAHSPTFPSLHLSHNSFSNPSVALPMPQLILQPIRYFTYVTVHSPTLLSLLLRHWLFTYVSWRAAHDSTFHNTIDLLFPFLSRFLVNKNICLPFLYVI